MAKRIRPAYAVNFYTAVNGEPEPETYIVAASSMREALSAGIADLHGRAANRVRDVEASPSATATTIACTLAHKLAHASALMGMAGRTPASWRDCAVFLADLSHLCDEAADACRTMADDVGTARLSLADTRRAIETDAA